VTRWRAACALLLIGLLAACSSGDHSPTPITATPVRVAMVPADATGPDEFPPGVNPLTGLRVDDPAVLHRRPLAVKISNAPDTVRPQAGIGAADVVFEHYVEARLTRFTAIFWTNTPPRVGSVRSARLIDLELPAMYGALFAYSGASDPIRAKIAALPFAPRAYEGVTTGEPLYFRDPALEPPHNLFVVPAQVWARAAADGLNDPPVLRGLAFSAVPPTGGSAVQRITVDFGPDVVRWDYDPASGRYLRRDDDAPHLDANTGQQVTAANVVLIYAQHQEDQSIVESEWQGHKDYSIEIQLRPMGSAVLFRDGQMVRGFWKRDSDTAPLSLWADAQGVQRLYLKPGSTWYEVLPLDFAGVQVE
jgi:hypothetical protein